MTTTVQHHRQSRPAKKVYAFGSSTPRTLSYLDHIPARYRVYDMKVSKRGAKSSGPSLRDYMAEARRDASPVRRSMRDRSLDSSLHPRWAFGSSTPRDLSYLNRIKPEYRIYDVKLEGIVDDEPQRSATTTFVSSNSGATKRYVRRTSSMSQLSGGGTANDGQPDTERRNGARSSRPPPRASASVHRGGYETDDGGVRRLQFVTTPPKSRTVTTRSIKTTTVKATDDGKPKMTTNVTKTIIKGPSAGIAVQPTENGVTFKEPSVELDQNQQVQYEPPLDQTPDSQAAMVTTMESESDFARSPIEDNVPEDVLSPPSPGMPAEYTTTQVTEDHRVTEDDGMVTETTTVVTETVVDAHPEQDHLPQENQIEELRQDEVNQEVNEEAMQQQNFEPEEPTPSPEQMVTESPGLLDKLEGFMDKVGDAIRGNEEEEGAKEEDHEDAASEPDFRAPEHNELESPTENYSHDEDVRVASPNTAESKTESLQFVHEEAVIIQQAETMANELIPQVEINTVEDRRRSTNDEDFLASEPQDGFGADSPIYEQQEGHANPAESNEDFEHIAETHHEHEKPAEDHETGATIGERVMEFAEHVTSAITDNDDEEQRQPVNVQDEARYVEDVGSGPNSAPLTNEEAEQQVHQPEMEYHVQPEESAIEMRQEDPALKDSISGFVESIKDKVQEVFQGDEEEQEGNTQDDHQEAAGATYDDDTVSEDQQHVQHEDDHVDQPLFDGSLTEQTDLGKYDNEQQLQQEVEESTVSSVVGKVTESLENLTDTIEEAVRPQHEEHADEEERSRTLQGEEPELPHNAVEEGNQPDHLLHGEDAQLEQETQSALELQDQQPQQEHVEESETSIVDDIKEKVSGFMDRVEDGIVGQEEPQELQPQQEHVEGSETSIVDDIKENVSGVTDRVEDVIVGQEEPQEQQPQQEHVEESETSMVDDIKEKVSGFMDRVEDVIVGQEEPQELQPQQEHVEGSETSIVDDIKENVSGVTDRVEDVIVRQEEPQEQQPQQEHVEESETSMVDDIKEKVSGFMDRVEDVIVGQEEPQEQHPQREHVEESETSIVDDIKEKVSGFMDRVEDVLVGQEHVNEKQSLDDRHIEGEQPELHDDNYQRQDIEHQPHVMEEEERHEIGDEKPIDVGQEHHITEDNLHQEKISQHQDSDDQIYQHQDEDLQDQQGGENETFSDEHYQQQPSENMEDHGQHVHEAPQHEEQGGEEQHVHDDELYQRQVSEPKPDDQNQDETQDYGQYQHEAHLHHGSEDHQLQEEEANKHQESEEGQYQHQDHDVGHQQDYKDYLNGEHEPQISEQYEQQPGEELQNQFQNEKKVDHQYHSEEEVQQADQYQEQQNEPGYDQNQDIHMEQQDESQSQQEADELYQRQESGGQHHHHLENEDSQQEERQDGEPHHHDGSDDQQQREGGHQFSAGSDESFSQQDQGIMLDANQEHTSAQVLPPADLSQAWSGDDSQHDNLSEHEHHKTVEHDDAPGSLNERADSPTLKDRLTGFVDQIVDKVDDIFDGDNSGDERERRAHDNHTTDDDEPVLVNGDHGAHISGPVDIPDAERHHQHDVRLSDSPDHMASPPTSANGHHVPGDPFNEYHGENGDDDHHHAEQQPTSPTKIVQPRDFDDDSNTVDEAEFKSIANQHESNERGSQQSSPSSFVDHHEDDRHHHHSQQEQNDKMQAASPTGASDTSDTF